MFNLLVSSGGWEAPHGALGIDRVLNQTDSQIVTTYTLQGQGLDFNELIKLPTLFIPEANGNGAGQYANLGTIKKVVKQGNLYNIHFSFDQFYKPIPLVIITTLADEFGTVGYFGLNTSHWAVKDNDLFEMLWRHVNTVQHSDYHIQEPPIGQGASGLVYAAHKEQNGITFPYAIKKFKPSIYAPNPDELHKRFNREVTLLLELQHHAIVGIIEANYSSEGEPFIVMPLIEGDALSDAVQQMTHHQRLQTFKIILEGVAYAHEKNVYHRDLKPSNIKVRSSDKHPLILDFGSGYLWDLVDGDTITVDSLGTPGYIPPEAVNDPKRRDPMHDIYSLAVTLYEIMSGHRPPKPPDPYRPLTTVNSNFAPLDDIIQQGMADVSTRTATVSDMRSQVCEALSTISWPTDNE